MVIGLILPCRSLIAYQSGRHDQCCFLGFHLISVMSIANSSDFLWTQIISNYAGLIFTYTYFNKLLTPYIKMRNDIKFAKWKTKCKKII